MYNMLFGENDVAGILLSILGKTREDFGRFRDAYLSEDGHRIIVYTRCGGGNREGYPEVFEAMSAHPQFITDYDDEFDCTYCSFEFSVPQEFLLTCEGLAKRTDTRTGSQKFEDAMRALDADIEKNKDNVSSDLIEELDNFVDEVSPELSKVVEELEDGR